MLKTPYSTNRHNIMWPKSYEDILSCLTIASYKHYGKLPYIMLQACMSNKREYKIVAIQGIPQYVAKIAKASSGQSFSTHPHVALFEFAAKAIQRAKLGCPGLVTDGLLRVDIFITMSGKLVVNELESLDAEYAPNSRRDQNYDHEVAEFLCQYWNLQLLKCFCNNHTSRRG